MKQPTKSNLSLVVRLLSSVLAACSGAGEGLITVGVRPTGGVAAAGGTAMRGAPGLPIPGIDVTNRVLDRNTSTPRGTAAAGASAGALASAGSSPGAAGSGAAAPDPAMAGAGGATGAADPLRPSEDECGAIPSRPAGNVTAGRVSGAGLIEYNVGSANVFVGLRTTVTVPAEPAPNGQIFFWPGIQPTPSGTNLQRLGNGALLSVVSWGPLCAPGAPSSYSKWWIAPMYSNITTSDPQYSGCHGGEVMLTESTQRLDIDIRLDGTKWVQKVVNRDTLDASDFSLDLKGQAQGRAIFHLEVQTSNKPTEDIVFTDTVLDMDLADPDACQPVVRGSNDFASKPRVSLDGKHCCIDRIVLRAARVMATTIDPP